MLAALVCGALAGCIGVRGPGASRYRDAQRAADEAAAGPDTGHPDGATDNAMTGPDEGAAPAASDPLAAVDVAIMVDELVAVAVAKSIGSVIVIAIVNETGDPNLETTRLQSHLTVALANRMPASVTVRDVSVLVPELEQSGRDVTALYDVETACREARRAEADAIIIGTVRRRPSGVGYAITIQLINAVTRAILGGNYQTVERDDSERAASEARADR